MKDFVLRYSDFINEARERFSKIGGKYVETDYTPYWRKRDSKGPQRYRNIEGNVALTLLKFIWEAGEDGRSAGEIKKYYFDLGAKDGKRYREDYIGYVPGEGSKFTKGEREYNSTLDRGLGSTLLYGSDYYGKQTGIFQAHCMKNEQGKWVLTDKRLKNYFESTKFSDMLDQDEFDTLDQLGMFDF